MLLMLVSVPVYLDVIGIERYGILTVIWLLLGYFGFFDLGIGRAVSHLIARSEDKVGIDGRSILWTGLFSSLPLAFIGVILLYMISGFALSNWVKVTPLLYDELDRMRLWVSLSLAPLIFVSVVRGALVGVRHFLRINIMGSVEKLMLQVFPLGMAMIFGPSLDVLVLAVFFARILGLIGWVVITQPIFHFLTKPEWKKGISGGLLRYGGWITVSSLAVPILSSAERLMLGGIVGAAAITYYSVPFSIVSPISLLANSMGEALFPLFALYAGRGERQLERRSAEFIVAIITPVLVVILFAAHPFISFWIGKDFAQESQMVPPFLVVGFWATSIAVIASSRLQGGGNPKIVAIIHMAEIFPYLVVLYILVTAYGILGAAIAWSLRVIIHALLLGVVSGLLRDLGNNLIFPFTLLIVSGVVVFSIDDIWCRAIIGVFMLLISIYWSWYYGFDIKIRNMVLYMVRKTI